MCFSATASFCAGTVLTVIGIASIKKTTQPSQQLFAAIPILFALQQFAEGFLWISLSSMGHGQMERISTTVFIVIAQIFWPLWVPLSVLLLENNRKLKRQLYFFTGLGFIVSLCMVWCLIVYGVRAKIDNYHISYLQIYPNLFEGLGGYLYVLATICPPFISHFKRMWILAIAILVSYLVTKIYYDNYLISVWCFFAAVLSAIVYVVVLEIRNKKVVVG